MAYTVIRTDLMSGTNVASDLVSVRVYESNMTDFAEVENGAVVELVEIEEGNREVWKGKLAGDSSDLKKCVVIATPEVMYDERKKNLDEFVNEAGTICRGYFMRSGNMFSITKEGFVNPASPVAKKGSVKVGENGKFETGEGLGEVVDVEVTNRYTYYTIRIA